MVLVLLTVIEKFNIVKLHNNWMEETYVWNV